MENRMRITYHSDQTQIHWSDLCGIYEIAPLGTRNPDDLETVFSNSMFKCFVFDDTKIIGAGRALADGVSCAYICDVALHPDYHGLGIGKKLVQMLVEQSKHHSKIILYANPGKEGFYGKLGFRKMKTAMAIFKNEEKAIRDGFVS
jgi:ribosomal protein S18 acetylase RimI-like enzyme